MTLLWAVGLNRSVEKSLLQIQCYRICCWEVNWKNVYLGKNVGWEVKITLLTSKKKSTGNLEIYCCSFPYLTILFPDIPLYLTAFLARRTKISLFSFSPISWLIHISCSNISLRGLIAEKIYLYWGLFYNTCLQKLPYNSSFCNIYITSNTASFSLSRDLKNWNWWSPKPPVFICPSFLGLILPGKTCHHICPSLKNN